MQRATPFERDELEMMVEQVRARGGGEVGKAELN
jgi:hypothetical protein